MLMEAVLRSRSNIVRVCVCVCVRVIFRFESRKRKLDPKISTG